jgi:hypothetical protein
MIMATSKAYYSLVQYCPDMSRLEAANVGVLLFCPEKRFLAARMSHDNSRIRRFFGAEGHDWQCINSSKLGLEERLAAEQGRIETLADLERFIATRANELRITPARPMKADDPATELDALFKELIGGPAHAEKTTSFRQFLQKKFHAAGVERKLQRDVTVTVPVFDREVRVPYGYQNGRFHLIQPVRFEGHEASQAVNTACRYAVEGRSIFEHAESGLGPMQLTVIGKFRANQNDARSAVRRVLDENAVRLFALNELPALIDEIRRTAKDLVTDGHA